MSGERANGIHLWPMSRHGGGPARPGRMGLLLLVCYIQIACLAAPGLSSPSVAPSEEGPAAAAAEVSAAQALHQTFEAQAQRQCFNFSLHQSVAREDFEYPDANGVRRSAKKGGRLVGGQRGRVGLALADAC